MRQQAAKADQDNAAKARQEKRKSQELDDYLDIPAFLRRQAD
jgi:cell division protein FtsZ